MSQRDALTVGYAGAYYSVDGRVILIEVDARKLVGGQEDMIADVALDLAGSSAT